MTGRTALGAALTALVPAAARADHGAGLSMGPLSPMMVAVLFGGLALLVGVIVVVIAALLAGKPEPGDPDARR